MLILKRWLVFSIALCFSHIAVAQSSTLEKSGVSKGGGTTIERALVSKNFQRIKGLAGSTSGTIQPFIVGGTDAIAGEHPWMAALLLSSEPDAFYAQFCGGTLIRADLVVTAAHCVDWLTGPAQIDVAVGAHKLTDITAQERIPILGIFIHPDYDGVTLDNDIAVLKLARNVSQPPMPLMNPSLMQTIMPGNLLTVTGWGTLQEDSGFFPNILQKVQVPLVGNLVCEQALSNFDPSISLTQNQICAGYLVGGKDSCQGDSGGPLVYPVGGQTYLTGIVSWGIGCALPEAYGVYTKASNYSEWTQSVTDTLYAPSSHNFKNVGVSKKSKWTATVLNLANSIAVVQDVRISGDSAYRIDEDGCRNKVLNPLAECKIEIKFKPRSPGIKTATVTILQHNGKTHRIKLTGLGLAKVEANSALDTDDLTWYSGGDAVWGASRTAGSVNSKAMRSGKIEDNQASHIMTYLKGPGELTFRWKVSSEGNYDYYDLLVDGRLANYISGEIGWSTETVVLGKGRHAITWSYAKDESVSEGMDAAWLDKVTWKRSRPDSDRSDDDDDDDD